jgi:hypothetical protein
MDGEVSSGFGSLRASVCWMCVVVVAPPRSLQPRLLDQPVQLLALISLRTCSHSRASTPRV